MKRGIVRKWETGTEANEKRESRKQIQLIEEWERQKQRQTRKEENRNVDKWGKRTTDRETNKQRSRGSIIRKRKIDTEKRRK